MNKNNQRTAIISSEEMSKNSYNTFDEEDQNVGNHGFHNTIRMKKERMNKFFLENPNLLNYFDFQKSPNSEDEDDPLMGLGSTDGKRTSSEFPNSRARRRFRPQSSSPSNSFAEKLFLEDLKFEKERPRLMETHQNKKKMLGLLDQEVTGQMNLQERGTSKALAQLFKKINVFKARVIEVDKSPFIESILEEDVNYNSDSDSLNSNRYKKTDKKKGIKCF